MVLFFFYNKLTNQELINKISLDYKIIDGSILVQDYNLSTNEITIGNIENNNKVLQGKIVDFDMSLSNVIYKINLIDECKSYTTDKKYIIETIQAICIDNKHHIAYIIH
jgi:uncharacterized surface protein with fasciclin (FAS1) repeats